MASAFAAAILLIGRLTAGPGEIAPASVVILANSDDPDSVPIAEHYADARQIPHANIFALRMPLSETITWREFVASVWQPFQDELVRKEWIDALPTSLVDEVGRRKYLIHGHRIGAIAVCRGVPLRISHDPGLYRELRPLTQNEQFRTNAGAVDSELSLLPLMGYPINAFLPNPLFRNDHPTAYERNRVVLVSRLDGPTAKDAFALVDNAILAEKKGLIGRAYVDLGGPHASGDQWLGATAATLEKLGFDLTVDRAPVTMPIGARFDAPVLYFGWYAGEVTGPFLLPGFRFPAGAVALHIYSFSAHTLRASDKAWCGPFIARGVTATLGNVYEPYLELTHRPDLFVAALARGWTLAEAAYYAVPELSWEAVVVGDPLYRPFAVSLAAQAKNIDSLTLEEGDYVTIRQANLEEQAGRKGSALALLETRHRLSRGLALSLDLARRLSASGDLRAAALVLHPLAATEEFAPGDWQVAHEAALELVKVGAPADAVRLYLHLFSRSDLERPLRLPWLADARQAALAARDDTASAAFKVQIDQLVDDVLSEK